MIRDRGEGEWIHYLKDRNMWGERAVRLGNTYGIERKEMSMMSIDDIGGSIRRGIGREGEREWERDRMTWEFGGDGDGEVAC